MPPINPQLWSLTFNALTIGAMAVAALGAIIFCALALPPLRLIRAAGLRYVETAGDAVEGISVIVIAETGRDTLSVLIGQLSTQQAPFPIEIIIVNASGEDYMEELIKTLTLTHPRLKTTFVPSGIRNVSRRKLATTLGIKAATQPIVLLCNSNCYNDSPDWLASFAAQFAAGADIVIGTSHIIPAPGTKPLGSLRSFDALRRIARTASAAAAGTPAGADAANLAYRRSLFFSNKGFARTLSLNYGDDDILVDELSSTATTVPLLDPASITAVVSRNARSDYDRAAAIRAFTESKLRTRAPFVRSAAATLSLWLTIIAALTAAITALPSLIPAAAMTLLLVALWTALARVWSPAAAATGITAPGWSALPLWLFHPLFTLRYTLRKDIKPHTWSS